MPWVLDLYRIVHLLESSDVRGGVDVRQSDLHIGTDLYAAVFHLFLYAHVPAVSVM